MSRVPYIENKHKICIICEGLEEKKYIDRLIELNVWNSKYKFVPINAKSASNIFARYQDAYNNAIYEMIVIFCDTDKKPYREYTKIKSKINEFHNSDKAAEEIVIFANPCTMQIILSHFGNVKLFSQSKKVNAPYIYDLTGVKNYDAKEEQIKEICRQIYQRTYPNMKKRIKEIHKEDYESCSTNFIKFIDYFECDDTQWIVKINELLENDR